VIERVHWKIVNPVVPSKNRVCPYCGSKVHKHGIRKTTGRISQEYICISCKKASYLLLSESDYDGSKQFNITIKLTDYQRGFLEAIIDGEGSLGLIKINSQGRTRWNPYCAISNTNMKILDKVKTITGGTIHSNGNEKNPRWHKCYEIKIPTNILRQILPQLDLCKSEQKRLVIRALELVNYQRGSHHPMIIEQYNELEEIHKKLRIINGRRYAL